MPRISAKGLLLATVVGVAASGLPSWAQAPGAPPQSTKLSDGAASTTVVTVTDRRTGEPLEQALILVGEATFTTDAQGQADVAAPAGTSIIVVANGYVVADATVQGAALKISLRPEADAETIIVSGETPEQTKATSYQLTGSEIARIPGAANDALRAVQSLPGVARIPFSFGGLALRGMSPRDTTVFLDGVEVPLVFHFGGLQSFVPSQIIESMDVQLGGFESRFGRNQGGIVDIKSINPRTDKWRLGGEVSLLHTALYAEGPLKQGSDTGVLLGIRRSYLDVFVRPFVKAEDPLPSYFDAQARLSWGNAKTTGHWAPLLITSWDRVASTDVSVNLAFVRLGVKHTRQPREGLTLSATPWLGVTTISFRGDRDEETDSGEVPADIVFRRPVYPYGVRFDGTQDYQWGHVRAGIDMQGGYLGVTTITGFERDEEDDEPLTIFTSRLWNDVGVWGELRYAPTPRWSVKPGIRLDYYGLTNEFVVDPRINLHQTVTDELTLRQAIGIFHQEPAPTELDTPFIEQKVSSSTTYQTSVGAELQLPAEITTSLVAFWHESRKLPVRSDEGRNVLRSDGMSPALFDIVIEYVGDGSYRRNIGKGRSMGLELMARRQVGRWLSFISYTYAKSKRTEDPALFAGWHAHNLDQPHRLHVVNSVDLGKWQLGAKFTLVSGNPYSPAVTLESPSGNDLELGFGRRLPTFVQLDFRVDRRWRKRRGDLTLFLDIQNVTFRKNVEGRDDDIEQVDGVWTRVREDTLGLPVLPIIGLMFTPR